MKRKRNLLMEQTHCFYFRPKKQGFFEYCLHSDILYKPEESRFGPFVEVIAGLDDNDISRIGIKCFSDMIMANITTIAAPRYEKENRATLERARKLLEAACREGFADSNVEIVKGNAIEIVRKMALMSVTHG